MTGYRELGRLALAREAVDRATAHRSDPDWLAAAWHSPDTRVVVVSEGGALVRFAEGRADLVFVSPAEAPPGVRFLLGTGPDAVAYFGVDAPLDQASPDGQRGQRAPDGATVRPASLRQVGALLGDRDAGLLTHAIALANWHDTHTHCPICGTPTMVNPGGHSTTCPRDGTEHFPRTDPAVIMLVTDPADRCLLANNKAWPQRRVSILAGFVDPGESAEHAVVREVSEETGIAVGQVTQSLHILISSRPRQSIAIPDSIQTVVGTQSSRSCGTTSRPHSTPSPCSVRLISHLRCTMYRCSSVRSRAVTKRPVNQRMRSTGTLSPEACW